MKKPISSSLLLIAACLHALQPALRAAEVIVVGTQGTTGISHYYPGTSTLIPGSDGGNGGAGGAASAVANAPGDAVNRATAQGGGGGQGGSGGLGIPNSVSPGRGGDGGPAGSASATATTDKTATGGDVEATAVAYSGSRGYWGIGGGGPETYGNLGAAASATANASAFTSAGRVTSSAVASGSGSGEGGPATAAATGGNTSSDPVGVTASARGGAGRSSPHSSGGNGDQGLLGTVSGSSTGGGRVTVTGRVTGGSGGTGVGSGGDGAVAQLVNAVTGSTSGDLDLVQDAFGGAGGQGTANGGDGAAGLSTLTHTHAGTGVFTTNVQAYGGVGGTALSGSAGNAGPATAQVNATGAGDVNATVGASGGAGGYGPSGTTPGAAATILPSSAISTGTGKTVRLSAYQGGGAEGGWNWATTANGSQGADSTLTNAVSGAAPGGSLFLTQTAVGGHGGMAVGQTGGRGGDATSSLTFAHSGEAQLNVNVLANAGSAGIANGSNQRNTRGGHATASGNVQDSGEVNLGLRALAGAGNDGGNASATGSAISTGAGKVYVGLEASGGTAHATTPNGTPGSATISGYGQSAGGDVTVSGTAYAGSGEPVNGTPSLVTGRSITLSNAVGGSTSGLLTLNQVAVGGMGTPDPSTGLKGSGGDATSSLVLPGGNPGGGPVYATVTAHGGGAANLTDTSPAPTGHATALGDITNADDVTVYATARAGSSVLGNTVLAKGTGAATARAVSTRPGGKATAFAGTDNGASGPLSATAETTGTRATLVRAVATGSGPTYTGFSTTAHTGATWTYATGGLGALGTPASFPPLQFTPGAATALEGMEPLAQVDARSDFATGSATFVLNTAAYAGNVKLALLGAGAFNPSVPLTSFQFTVTRGGTAVVDETFTTWTAAIAWMTDRVIDLGTASQVNGQPLIFTFTFNGVDAANPAHFSTRMVVGAKTAYRAWAESYQIPTDSWIDPATHDEDHDGLVDLLEWALGLSPVTGSGMQATTTLSGATLEYHYTRSTAAANAGTPFIIEWSDNLPATSWSTTGVTQQVLSDNGTLQQVKATLPAGTGGKRFVRLRVTAPLP
jgi:hypothetical protein